MYVYKNMTASMFQWSQKEYAAFFA